MPRSGVVGCLARFNSVLMAGTTMPYSFECSVDVDDVRDYGDVVWTAREAVEMLSSLLGLEFNISFKARWEYIGRRFNLYAYPLTLAGQRVGELRVVEAGGFIVNVTGGLNVEIDGLADNVMVLREKRVVWRGNIVGTTYLEPGGGSPGQLVIEKPVVYAVEGIPDIDTRRWRLVVKSYDGAKIVYTYEEILRRSRSLGEYIFHCVTGWSVRRNWKGIPLSELLEETGFKGKSWLAARSINNYATIVPLETAIREGILVTHVNGKPLPREHGFPARLFFPSLYGWKAAKWVTEIMLMDRYEDGYWETLGYHERGLVEAEERFKIRNPAIASMRRLPPSPRKLPPNTSMIKP